MTRGDRPQLPPHQPRKAGAPKALEGIKVVDFSIIMAGPFCTQTLGDLDVLVVPSSQGEAPKGNATGLPYFNRTWSLMHTPCVHVPYGTGPNGLPIGFQVVGRIGDDARTLAAAHWLQVNVAAKGQA